MANEKFPILERQISSVPTTEDPVEIKTFLDREVTPLLIQFRALANRFFERPQVPIFESSPITDIDLDPFGTRPPADGTMALSSTDGKLYVRVDGAWSAIV